MSSILEKEPSSVKEVEKFPIYVALMSSILEKEPSSVKEVDAKQVSQ
jgi:hypothetical protein